MCTSDNSYRSTSASQLTAASAAAASLDFFETALYTQKLRYNVLDTPPFFVSPEATQQPTLNQIVAGILSRLEAQNYPIENVSISLVDLTGSCCDYSHYQGDQKRYPASVVKLFWLVALYGQYEAGVLQPETTVLADDEVLMAHYSNNGASSRILDAITETESGEDLAPQSLQQWITARNTVNEFFLAANYPDLNIAHKTYPIPDLALDERTGRDLQFANEALPPLPQRPTGRNYLTTYATARLLYEIDTGQAISQAYSDRLKQHLFHSPDPAIWQYEEVNAIADFFGEYLPPDAQLYTKLGYTFDDGRQEAAIIASPDGQTRFILVVFANDPAYSVEGSKAFPELARYVYDQMRSRS
jgi:beta-lactamase class A